MIKTMLTVRCVLGHEHELEDHDDKVRLQGYTRCTESGCKRNAFVVKIATHDNGSIENNMRHLDETSQMSDITLDGIMLYAQKVQAERDKLRTENKSLKEELEHLQKWITEKCQENRVLGD